jgi:hypothetical protein
MMGGKHGTIGYYLPNMESRAKDGEYGKKIF